MDKNRKTLVGSSASFVIERRSQFSRWACVLLLVASLLRYWVSYDPTDTVPHHPESFRLAYSLAETGRFANPFGVLDTGPSAHLAPAFPAFLALLIRIFGSGSLGVYVIEWMAAILLSVQLALFPMFSRALGMGELNGVIGAAVWIVAKVGIASPLHPVPMYAWESFYGAFFLVTAVCCCRRYLDLSLYDSNRLAWLIGILLGVLALTSPGVGIVFIGWMVWVALRARRDVFRRSSLLVILLPTLIVAPWMVRNYRVFGRLVFIRDAFGMALATSNNDCAMFGIEQNFGTGCFEKVHPNENLEEARKVLAEGEPKYNELELQQALRWTKSDPRKFSKLCALRFWAFWFPPATGSTYSLWGSGRRLERFAICVMTLFSVPGLFMLYRRDKESAVLCAMCLALYPLVHYLVMYEFRYRYPILWVTFLLGAFPITTLARMLTETKQLPPREELEPR